ncbi:efflux RND transporter periplasmic adaptor subunit [Bizionia gelidisalsuginis]|uniref:Efflux RND transporter periplasmic adaptor subunit n=1 Tax=Bizionia gelidisalsuginis TaxID=291188 RepID=A0ABY3MCY6_9FLAO|nr:efflux RND transporter periplasmic adaptor subunit [Bizionia gelidisalsuginis]TYC16249.1 efflux RND transporter periplasmic adaptor subunit [Bizionia gelidisalsuginis]
MKNNKIIMYAVFLTIGVSIGWFVFGGDSNKEIEHNHEEVAESKKMWTCSMHPQIMQSEPGDCPICGMDLIPAASSSEGLAANAFKLTPNAMALANIQTRRVGKAEGDAENRLVLSGKIAQNEEENKVQASYFSGRIERLNVSYTGEEIRKGQLLATLYSPELYAAQQELITTASLKKTQPDLYQAVRNKLKLWKLSETQIQQIESSGIVKEYVPIYATVSGTVTEKLVNQGDYVKQGQPLLKVTNLNTVWAQFDVYENQINLIKNKQTVMVSANAYPNKEVEAVVDFISPTLNTTTRTTTLRVVLKNKEGVFKPGMFVSATVNVNSDRINQELKIPASAVMWTGKRSVIYVKKDENTPVFEMREVTLGHRVGESYVILEGLTKGEEIVVNGTFTVDAAAQLRGKKSMMNASNTSNTSVVANTEPKLEVVKRLKASKVFQQQLKTVYDSYIQVKDALAEDNVAVARDFSEVLLKKVNNLALKELETTEAKAAGEPIIRTLFESTKNLAETRTIAGQREVFQRVSLQLATAIKLFGINEEVFNLHCPMANNDNGAYWLSTSKHVLNPYFGAAMLKCGEVKDSIE